MARLCFRSIHCVKIEKSSYLYIQASVECFQDWQYLIILFMALWIIPFPLIPYFGCRSLRRYRISPNEFLMIMTFPPIAFYYIILRLTTCYRQRCHVFDEHAIQERESILLVLNEPFRSTMEPSKNTLIWEPILIFRRLILIALTTFILSPIVKLYPVCLVLVAISIHDYWVKPYSSDKLNLLQQLSTLVLILLLLLNMFWALTNEVENQQYFLWGKIFIFAEVILLILPFIVGFCYLVYKIVVYCS